MPASASTVRGLTRDLGLDPDDPEHAMLTIDRDEAAAVCRHLLGELDTRATPEQPR